MIVSTVFSLPIDFVTLCDERADYYGIVSEADIMKNFFTGENNLRHSIVIEMLLYCST
jgi:hypothetical protein